MKTTLFHSFLQSLKIFWKPLHWDSFQKELQHYEKIRRQQAKDHVYKQLRFTKKKS